MDKEQLMKLIGFLRAQLKEIASMRDYLAKNDAGYANKQIQVEGLLEWAEEEAVKLIKAAVKEEK